MKILKYNKYNIYTFGKNILTNTNTKIKNKNNPKKNYSNNLLKKCQMKYNSFIREHRDITMSGNKRYDDKSGEY